MFLYGGAVSDNSWNRYREQSIRRSNKTGYFRHFQNEQAATAAQNGNALQRLIRILRIFCSNYSGNGSHRFVHGIKRTSDTGCSACILWDIFGCNSTAIPSVYSDSDRYSLRILPVLVCWSAFKNLADLQYLVLLSV